MDTDLTEPDRPRPDAADEGSVVRPRRRGRGRRHGGRHRPGRGDRRPRRRARRRASRRGGRRRREDRRRPDARSSTRADCRLTTADAVLARITPAVSLDELPECGLVIEAVPEDLDLKRRIFADLADRQPLDHRARDEHLEHRHRRHRRRRRRPRARARPALLQPAARHEARRGRARRAHRPGLRRARHRAHARVGQDAGAVRSTPGFIVNRVARPFYGEAQRIVESGRRRRGDGRLGAARARRLPDGAARAHRLHRPGRQPRRRHVGLGADRPRRALRADGPSSATSSRRAGSAASRARGVYTYAADGSVERGRARRRAGRAPRRRTGRDRPARPHARDARQRGRRPRGTAARRRPRTSTRRCGSACATREGPIEWGREIGFDVVAAPARRARRGLSRAGATARARP